MKTDLLWLLWVAWAFCVVGAWSATAGLENKLVRGFVILVAAAFAAVAGAVLHAWLQPPMSYVYVAPGVWSPGPVPQWIMLVKHGGPDPVFNIDVLFVDKDRQAGLGKKKSATPQEIEEMQTTLHFPEIDHLESGLAKMFFWSPLNPGDEHYEVLVTSRSGTVFETLDIQRTVTGKWQYRIKVVNCES